MKKLLHLAVLGLLMVTAQAQAEGDKAPSKMSQCHKDAKVKNLKGDERKAFMKECLSAKKTKG